MKNENHQRMRWADKAGWKPAVRIAGILPALLVALSCGAEIKLGDWHVIGPFKLEEFGNVARELEFRFGPEVDYLGEQPVEKETQKTGNLALGAKATSPDKMAVQKKGDEPSSAVDGNLNTFWDDEDKGSFYALRLDFKNPTTFNTLKLTGWKHHECAAKAFSVVCDGQEVAKVEAARYAGNVFELRIPETTGSSLELRITGVYGKSPAIRELELYNIDFAPVAAAVLDVPDLSKNYQMKKFPGYLELDRKWEKRADWTDGFHNLLPRGPAPSRNESVYLYRTITADEAKTVTAHLRMKDFYKVWLNGRQVAVENKLTKFSIYPKPLPVKLNLQAGENQLLVKNTVRWAERGFSFGIEGMHEIEDSHYIDINTHENKTDADAKKYVEGFKFKPEPIPMYAPEKYAIDEYLSRFTASPAATAYDKKLAALKKRKSGTLAFAKELEGALDAEIEKLPPILFIRHPLCAVNAIAPYINTGAVPSSICLLDPSKPGAEPKVVFQRPELRIYDMSLSFDAKTILFSGKKEGKDEPWHIYSVGVDGQNLKQITTGDSDNISPCELPNGRLAFISTRHGTFVVCQPRRAGILFTMEKDGSDLRLISANIDSDHSPRVTNDGRIIFTRWDYGIEKNVFARHGLWAVNPDGTHLQLFFGNTIEDPGGFWSPVPVPDRPEIVCVFGPHHQYHAGMIGLVWNGRGTENPRGEGYRWVSREMPVYGDHAYPDGYQDPYAVNEKQFLCSYGGTSGRTKGGDKKGMTGMAPLKLMYLDAYGNERIIHKDPNNLSCYQPILLRSRKTPPVIPDSIPPNPWTYQDPETMNRENAGVEKTATMLVQDVYRGISTHVKRGEAKYIAVMEQVQKSRQLTGGEAWGHSPLIGRGTVHARRLIGLVPIEEDGSAHFTIPSLRSISLNVLNTEGKTLMRMGSDMHTMPGERISCIGCHEVREGIGGKAPMMRSLPLAAKKPPASPKPPEAGWGTDGLIDYIQVIQPIWDKHCVSCHKGAKPDGNVNMTADKTRFFCQSYGQLVDRDIVDHLSVFSLGHDENTPLTVGAMVSSIDEFLTEEHCESKLTWEERFRIYCWIDANVPYYGTYDSELVEGQFRGLGMRDSWETKNKKVTWATKDLQSIFDRRCMECHRRPVLNQSWLIPVEMEVASDIWGDKALTSHGFGTKWTLVNKLGPEFRINLTNPSHSSLLMAPLAKKGGGLGMCSEKDGAPVFADQNDADYQAMLKAIETGAARLGKYPRIDMLGRERLMNPRKACFKLSVDPETAEAGCGVELPPSHGIPRGFVVCVGNGAESSRHWKNPGTVFQCLETSDAEVSKVRKTIKEAGCYGRVSADTFDGENLPYVDGAVNCLLLGDGSKVSKSEIQRVLAPGGMMVANGKMSIKPVPEELDEWTHFMYDASGIGAGNDRAVGPPRHIQWEAGPRYSRSHENMSSVSASVTAGGRIFTIMDEGPKASIYLPSDWNLTARDAFSGVLLWKIPIKEWHARLFPLKSGPTQLPHRLVAVGDRVYVTLGLYAPVSELAAATGNVLRTFEGTEFAEELRVLGGKLIVVTHDDKAVNPFRGLPPKAHPDLPLEEQTISLAGSRSLAVIDLENGKTVWSKSQGDMVPLTTVVLDGNIFLIVGNALRCAELASGKMLWEQSVAAKSMKISTAILPTVLAHEGTVFAAVNGELSAFDAAKGDKLWDVPCAKEGFRMPASIFIVNGLIWDVNVEGEPYKPKNKNLLPVMETTDIPPGPGVEVKRRFVGYDLRTGEVRKDIPMYGDQSFGVMHHRCHIPRATGDYLLTGYPGIEFIDTNTGKMQAHSWIRGACLYGFMPANGLIYTLPHPCACYSQAKMSGFNAVAPQRRSKVGESKVESRLVKSPAYSQVSNFKFQVSSASWPTFRGDASRSGFSKTTVPAKLSNVWKARLEGKLTQPVVADDKVFVASVDAHTVYALDENSGKVRWEFIAGGRVDSPPTFYKGSVIFGSRDGDVYCLRASDGALAWRFLAARDDQRIISYEQPESVWPVHGSVLIENGSLYFAAGRNAFLDGGLYLYRLDPTSGKMLSEQNICMLGKDGRQPPSLRLQMDAAMPDVLSSDGKNIFMRQYAMDLEGRKVEPSIDHLFCPTGFLDDDWFRRSYWLYGNVYFSGAQGWATSGNILPSGRIMAIGADRIYGFGRDFYPPSPGNGDQMYAKGEKEVLFASKKMNFTEEYKLAGMKTPYAIKTGKQGKGKAQPEWTASPDMRVMGMVLTADKLFIAGTKGDWIVSRDALDGVQGISLMTVSTETGKTLSEAKLQASPVFDGMAAANGKLFISTSDGSVLCFGK